MTPICTPWNLELTAASRSTTDSPRARGSAASAIRPTSRLVYRMLHLTLLQLDVPALAEHRLHVLVGFFVVGDTPHGPKPGDFLLQRGMRARGPSDFRSSSV